MKGTGCILQHADNVGKLGERMVALSRGDEGPEFVDLSDPRAVLEAKEEAEAARESGQAETPQEQAADVLGLLLAYLLGVDPHPAHVLRRLWLATVELAPELTEGISAAERPLLADPGEEGHHWRVGLLVRGTAGARRRPADHDAVCRRVLHAAYQRRRGLALLAEVPLSALAYCRPSETVAQFGARQRAVVELLRFFWVGLHALAGLREGLRPERAVRMVLLVAKATHPQLILHMSLQNLGDLFAEERATWSHRGKHKLTAFLAARGAVGFRASYQRTDEACAHYSAVQIGNRNRVGLPRRRCA